MTTKSEMTTLLQQEVKGLTSYLVDDDYSNACDDAARETGWAFPVSGDTKIYWQKERAKRHLHFYLASESSHKFKYKQISLQHRFEHHWKIIETMDKKWKDAEEGLIIELSGAENYELFGTKVDAGFAYEEQTGRDITYDNDQIVIHSPNEAS